MAATDRPKEPVDYRSLVTEINSLIDEKGEAEALKEIVASDRKAHLRDYCRSRLIDEIRILEIRKKMPVDELAEEIVFQGYRFRLNPLCWSLADRHQSYLTPSAIVDLGKRVPPLFLKALLRDPHPFGLFWDTMTRIEVYKLLWGASAAGRLLDAVMKYRESKAHEREAAAMGFLGRLTFGERASLAMHCQLGVLAILEEQLGERVGALREAERRRLRNQGASYFEALEGSPPMNTALVKIQTQFPDFEMGFADEVAKKTALPEPTRMEFAATLKNECSLLIRIVAEAHFGLSDTDPWDGVQKATTPALHKLAREHYHPGQIHPQDREGAVFEESFVNAQTSFWSVVDKYVADRLADPHRILTDGICGMTFPYLYRGAANKLIDMIRKETPEFAREWNRLRMQVSRNGDRSREIKRILMRCREEGVDVDILDYVKDPADRKRLIKKIVYAYLKGHPNTLSGEADISPKGSCTKPRTQRYGTVRERRETGRPSKVFTLFDDVIEDTKAQIPFRDIENEAERNWLINNELPASLTARQRFVLKERKLEGKRYAQIRRDYEREFGKPVKESTIRSQPSEARRVLIAERQQQQERSQD